METLAEQANWLDDLRNRGLKLFHNLPIPTPLQEDYRYTSLQNLDFQNFLNLGKEAKPVVKAPENVIVQSFDNLPQNSPEKLENYLSQAIRLSSDKLTGMHYAYFNTGLFIQIPENTIVEKPIESMLSGNGSILSHTIIVLGKNSKATIFENLESSNTSSTINTSFTEIFAGENSDLHFCSFHNWDPNVWGFSIRSAIAERNSRLNWYSGLFGGRLARLKIDTHLNGPGAATNNYAVFLGKGSSHSDITTNTFHNVPHTTNDILVKGILRDASSSVYRGKIKILKGAQQTNSYLADHVLKMGKQTLANSIPSLEIDANDVRASHGATMQQLDENIIFYLMSRGLGRFEAEELVMKGFVEPVLQRFPEILQKKSRKMF